MTGYFITHVIGSKCERCFFLSRHGNCRVTGDHAIVNMDQECSAFSPMGNGGCASC